MSLSDDSEASSAREVEITFVSDKTKAKGEIIQVGDGELVVKIPSSQVADRDEILSELSDGEEPVAVWAQITDRVSGQLLREGQSLLAWVRVKQRDGRFVTKTALFSLGAVAAVTVTRRAIQHYKSR
ncbi:MAG TPA: hypothetical protein VGO98_00625 [Candidatus Saccharimonadales bacterium]|jgi:hypothetical protein|nr:hypothetical protein [Candidatus Saccharimonadales bacterium]